MDPALLPIWRQVDRSRLRLSTAVVQLQRLAEDAGDTLRAGSLRRMVCQLRYALDQLDAVQQRLEADDTALEAHTAVEAQG